MIFPLLLAWNCTPRFTGLVSAASTAPDGAAPCQMLHGHWDTAPVVKFHVNGLLIGVPEVFCAPDTAAVYVVLPASGFVGVNVATVLPLLKLTVPATGLLLESFTVNVAVGAADTGFPVDPAAGVTVVTVGGIAPADGEYTTSTQ